MRLALSFDDVLITPTFSNIKSRTQGSVKTSLGDREGSIKLNIPLISSPMDTVTEDSMAIKLGSLGGMGVVHRFCTVQEQSDILSKIIAEKREQILTTGGSEIKVVPSVGVTTEEFERFSVLHDKFGDSIDMICIDIANGYSSLIEKMISAIKSKCRIPLMVGNIATPDGYEFLSELNVDAVRIGIGGGSICKTRIQSGVGVPTLQSILDCHERRILLRKNNKITPAIIADGGIKYPADIAKSLIAGADAVMCGGIFAGTQESPGETILDNQGKAWKKYRGMASEIVQIEKKGGMKEGTVAEGVSTLVPYKGSLKKVVTEFIGGLKVSMSYVNSEDLSQYIGRPELFIRITENGVKESHAYGTRER